MMSGATEEHAEMKGDSPPRQRKAKRQGTRPVDILLTAVIPLAILLMIWQFIAYFAQGLGLLDIANSFVKLVIKGDADGTTLGQHTAMSMVRVTLGFALAAATAIPLGIAVGRYRLVSMVLGPVVEAFRPLPPIAWIPLSILLFRSNLIGAQVFIIWLGAFFPILINTTAGVKRTSTVHLDVASTFGTSERQILSKIVLPSAAPETFAGLRIGFGIGWMCLVAAEMFGSAIGLGYLVTITQQTGKTGETISAMIVIGFIGFLISYVFLRAEKRLLRWRREVAV
ncbi:MAG: ABC transporter permease [Candidatus Thorarchaeota archaeon]|nr:MAG: ABC transporter permease [Candidatus Thorarchaeota archaeon]